MRPDSPPPLPRRGADAYHLWFHIARLREANDDHAGAERAKRNARIMPNREMRTKFRKTRPSEDNTDS